MVDYKNFDFEESEPRDSHSPTVGDDMEGLYIRKRIYAKRWDIHSMSKDYQRQIFLEFWYRGVIYSL